MSYHPNSVRRRAAVARGLLVAAFTLLGGAFFRAQVLRNEEFVLKSESNRLREVPLPGARGIIYDRNGQIIAENLPGYSVSLLSPSVDSLKSALRSLSQVVEIDSAQQALALRRFRAARTRPATKASGAGVSSTARTHVERPSRAIGRSDGRRAPSTDIGMSA